MNNYYTLIYLNRELNGNLPGGNFDFAISPHKDVLECYISFPGADKRLVTGINPAETALFLDDYRPPKKQNVLTFFQPLRGRKIVKFSLAEHDRLLSLHFENDMRLLFKLFGHDANVLLTKDDRIIDAFKHPEKSKGQPVPKPQTPVFADVVTGKGKAKNELTKLNPLLPRNLLPPLIEQHNVKQMDAGERQIFTRKITDMLLHHPQPRVLKTGDVCLWPYEMLSLPAEKSFDSVNDTVRYAYRNAVHLRRLHSKKERLMQFVQRSLKKKKAEFRQLQSADKSLRRAEEYEKYGHLLMAKAHTPITPGSTVFETDDFYEENKPIEIPIKEGLTVAENAQHYYEKAKSSRTSYEKAKGTHSTRRIKKNKNAGR